MTSPANPFQKNKNGESALEANLIEVANYLYSHNIFILIAAIGTAAVVGIWAFFFSTQKYVSTATVVYNYAPSSPLESEAAFFYTRQAEIENKLYVLSVFV